MRRPTRPRRTRAGAVVVVVLGLGLGVATSGCGPTGPGLAAGAGPSTPAATATPTTATGPTAVPSAPPPTSSTPPAVPGVTPTTLPTPAAGVRDHPFGAPPASATRLGPWSARRASSLPGTAYFFTDDGYAHQLSVLGHATLLTSALGTLDATSCIANTFVVSPDGTHVAWVRGSVDDFSGGQLVVTDLRTRRASAVAEHASCQGGAGPKWTNDSRSVVYDQDGPTQTAVRVSLDTGATTTLGAQWYPYRPMVPGFWAAADWTSNPERVVVHTDAGAVVRQVGYAGYGSSIGFSVQGISYDGRYVGLNGRNTDPSVVRTVRDVIDTVTGSIVALPVPAGRTLRTMLFLPGGAMLLQTGRTGTADQLNLVDPHGMVTTVSLPAGLGVLLRYVP